MKHQMIRRIEGTQQKSYRNPYIYLLSAGHLFTDFNQGALPAILPFFILEYHFNYAIAASLVFAANLVSSIVQPLFGYLTDRRSMSWLMPVGILLAGGGLAATGFLSSYWLIVIAVMISGIGMAAFHPEAARIANRISGAKQGTGMSIFSFGGNAGFAVGPIFTTAFITLCGMKGVFVLIVPAAIMAVAITSQLGKLKNINVPQTEENSAGTVQNVEVAKDHWGPFSLLTVILFGRSIVFYGLNTFLALYWINVLHQSKTVGSTALTILFAIGAIGTLIGGHLADRLGFKKVIRFSLIWLAPLLFAQTITRNVFVAAFCLIPIGLALFAPYSPMVVLGQKYLPNRLGLASGVTLGLAVSVGGIATPLLGRLADSHGLLSAMYVIAAVAILPAIMSFTLPNLNRLKSKHDTTVALDKEDITRE